MDVTDLYQEIIIDHGTNPRNFHPLPPPCECSTGFNPLCGDKVKIYLRKEDGRIKQISFDGAGCAISMASASLMTELLVGKTLSEAREIAANFKKMVTGDNVELSDDFLKLKSLAGVKEYPSRVKCATLAWHALKDILLPE